MSEAGWQAPVTHGTSNARRRRLLVIAVLPLAALGSLAFFGWAMAQYVPTAAVLAVRQYLAVAQVPGVERCVQPTSYAPYQTNGNRLRRRLRGQPADTGDVSVDFSDCMVRFYLRRQPAGSWQVYRVQPHAG